MKSKKYHTVGRFPKYNIKIVERGTIATFNTYIHERSLSLGICTAIKSGGVKLFLRLKYDLIDLSFFILVYQATLETKSDYVVFSTTRFLGNDHER